MKIKLPSLNPLASYHKPTIIPKPPDSNTQPPTTSTGVPVPVPSPPKQPPLALCMPCRVVKVYDGDTANQVRVELDLNVRYISCWAPELSEPGGPEARDRAKQAEGKIGRVYIDLNNLHNLADLFTFGRVLGEIWLEGENESESQKQVRLKMASTVKGGKLGT